MFQKEKLEYLKNLSRLEIPENEEERLLNDLEKILKHFEELKEINTDNIEPMSGGTFSKNILREDIPQPIFESVKDNLLKQFPEKEKRFLKIPPVFQ